MQPYEIKCRNIGFTIKHIIHMKKYIFLLIPVLGLLAFAAFKPSENKHIEFSKLSYSDALKKAKNEKKIVFVDAYADWCGPCKMMERNTFSNAEVADYFNSHFINLKMDVETAEGNAIAEDFGVTALPTLLFIGSDGKAIKKTIGYMDAERLLTEAKSL